MKNFVEELKWRGMIQDIMPGTEEKLMEGPQAAYVGIDPTADSLHIGPSTRTSSSVERLSAAFEYAPKLRPRRSVICAERTSLRRTV